MLLFVVSGGCPFRSSPFEVYNGPSLFIIAGSTFETDVLKSLIGWSAIVPEF